MLVLKRKEGNWIEVTHRSGDVLRIRTQKIGHGQVDLCFEDGPRNFDIQRPERRRNDAATLAAFVDCKASPLES